MKKIFLLAVIALSSSKIFAQEHKDDDTLKIKWKGSRIWIFDDKDLAKKDSIKTEKKKKQDFTHWSGIDLGVCMLSTFDNKLKLPDEKDTTQLNNFLGLKYGKSWYLSLNLFKKNIHIYKNYVNIVTGLGVEWSRYDFKKNITLNPSAPYISASNTTIAPDSIHYSKNMLRVIYLKAPLLVELNSNTRDANKSFHISAGMEFAYKIGSKTKQSYELNGYEYNVKRRDDYHLADFKYSAVVRAGYGNYFTVFANYGLSQLFEKDKGPQVYPITAGISFTF